MLLGTDRAELDELFREVVELPLVDAALQLDLPRLLPPELERLRAAIAHDDHVEFEAARSGALALLDTPERRASLARAVLRLRDDGSIGHRLAAVAIIDLADAEDSALLEASLTQSVAVSVGAARTPAGLIVRSL